MPGVSVPTHAADAAAAVTTTAAALAAAATPAPPVVLGPERVPPEEVIKRPRLRGLHLSTVRFNVSAFRGIGGA
jgi:hypothetical protein